VEPFAVSTPNAVYPRAPPLPARWYSIFFSAGNAKKSLLHSKLRLMRASLTPWFRRITKPYFSYAAPRP
jgi:hypothetical protein